LIDYLANKDIGRAE